MNIHLAKVRKLEFKINYHKYHCQSQNNPKNNRNQKQGK